MSSDQFFANWHYPSSIRTGIGRVSEIAAACRELHIGAPLLVTDSGLAELDMVKSVEQACTQEGLNCQMFSDIKGNPDGNSVAAGVKAYYGGQHDGVIALGGGSALDVGKAIALMSGQNRPLWDFEDSGDNWRRVNVQGVAPVIAIPTTAGTGSEVGRASVITDSEKKVKKIIFHPEMQPKIVFLDPLLTVGLPRAITAATGMDALSHNLEAYCSPSFHPMAQGIAVEGIRLVKDYLPRAYSQGDDLDARMKMLVASCMGATAFQKGLGGMHALAHPLGGLYDTHHGLLNAILMPYLLKANQSAIESAIIKLAGYLQLDHASFDGFLNWVVALRHRMNIPHTLQEVGINDTQAERVGMMAIEDPSGITNPVQFTAEDYAQIFHTAVHGVL